MNNTSYNASPSMKKITDLNADMANEFVKNKLFCFEERVNREKALITTSQIRKFLSALNCLENKISFCEKELSKNEMLKKHWEEFKTNMYNWSQEDKKSLLTALDLIIYLNRKEVKDE